MKNHLLHPRPALVLKNSYIIIFIIGAFLFLGCAKLRPYRMGGPELEKMKLDQPPPSSGLSKLPDGRPLVVSMFSWRVANPVGLKLNLWKSSAVSIMEGTYYSRGTHVSIFESVFDALRARRRMVFRDYLGATQPGIVPAWARAQRFLILDGEIVGFEHSKIYPSGGVKPPNSSTFNNKWGHEAGYVEVVFSLRDATNGKTIVQTKVATWTKGVHSHDLRGFDPIKALGVRLVQLLEQNPAFMAALGGGK